MDKRKLSVARYIHSRKKYTYVDFKRSRNELHVYLYLKKNVESL